MSKQKYPEDNTPQNSSYTATYHSSRKLSKLSKLDMQNTGGEVKINSLEMYSCRPLHMNEQRWDDQQEPIYNSSVLEDLPGAMDDRDGGQERAKEIRASSVTWD